MLTLVIKHSNDTGIRNYICKVIDDLINKILLISYIVETLYYLVTNSRLNVLLMNHVNKLIFIVGMQGTTVWWLHDTQFQEPKVYIYCDIQSDLVQQSFIKPRYTSKRKFTHPIVVTE